jgi:hypothetical protein
MKPKKSNSQTVLKHVTTYGWIVLIVVLVIVILWSTGGPPPQPRMVGCTGFSQISPEDPKVSYSDGNLISFNLLNNAGMKLNLNSINVTFSGSRCTYSVGSDLRAGQSMPITIPKSGDCSNITVPSRGDYYRAELRFDYKNNGSGIKHLSVGECHGQVE